MQEIIGNIWEHHSANPVVITTNLNINRFGCNVMGRGVALEAKNRFPNLPKEYGEILELFGNDSGVYYFPVYNLYTFPTKYHWRSNSSLELIFRSACDLVHLTKNHSEKVYLPRPGCGNGNLEWPKVREILEPILRDEKYVIVSPA